MNLILGLGLQALGQFVGIGSTSAKAAPSHNATAVRNAEPWPRPNPPGNPTGSPDGYLAVVLGPFETRLSGAGRCGRWNGQTTGTRSHAAHVRAVWLVGSLSRWHTQRRGTRIFEIETALAYPFQIGHVFAGGVDATRQAPTACQHPPRSKTRPA
jgi:hypothetical protein